MFSSFARVRKYGGYSTDSTPRTLPPSRKVSIREVPADEKDCNSITRPSRYSSRNGRTRWLPHCRPPISANIPRNVLACSTDRHSTALGIPKMPSRWMMIGAILASIRQSEGLRTVAWLRFGLVRTSDTNTQLSPFHSFRHGKTCNEMPSPSQERSKSETYHDRDPKRLPRERGPRKQPRRGFRPLKFGRDSFESGSACRCC